MEQEGQPTPQPQPAPQEEAKLPLPAQPRDPESFAKATLKGTVEAGATFIKAAATPVETPSEEIKVRIFNKEPQSVNIPDAVRDAQRREIAKQIRKRETKAASFARTRVSKPERAKERQQIRVVRGQIAQLQKQAAEPPSSLNM